MEVKSVDLVVVYVQSEVCSSNLQRQTACSPITLCLQSRYERAKTNSGFYLPMTVLPFYAFHEEHRDEWSLWASASSGSFTLVSPFLGVHHSWTAYHSCTITGLWCYHHRLVLWKKIGVN
ncbi:unnamed protein product [Larinioides sclopetarius]|uniref:Uncharacterized protein n=1 Tax=Larinioides sclopetarius TaxID=280406 RepID=A0AAV2BIY7_9ARAC